MPEAPPERAPEDQHDELLSQIEEDALEMVPPDQGRKVWSHTAARRQVLIAVSGSTIDLTYRVFDEELLKATEVVNLTLSKGLPNLNRVVNRDVSITALEGIAETLRTPPTTSGSEGV